MDKESAKKVPGTFCRSCGKQADRQLVQQRLQHWQSDADLSGIRDAKELAQLPAGERPACEKLWADAAALLTKTQPKK